MTLSTTLACPFPYGYAGVEYLFIIPKSQQYLLKNFAIKLKTIVRNNSMRDPKPSDNIFPNKSLASMSLIFDNGLALTHLVK